MDMSLSSKAPFSALPPRILLSSTVLLLLWFLPNSNPALADQIRNPDSPSATDTFDLVWSMAVSWPDSSNSLKSTASLTLATATPNTDILINKFASGSLKNAFPLRMIVTRKKDFIEDGGLTPTPSSSLWPVELGTDGRVVQNYISVPPNTRVFSYSGGLLIYTESRLVPVPPADLPAFSISSDQLFDEETVGGIFLDPTGLWGLITNKRATYHTEVKGNLVQILSEPITSVRFSSDGQIALAMANYPGYEPSLHVFDASGTTLYTRTLKHCKFSNLHLSSDGDFLYLNVEGCHDDGDQVIDLRNKKVSYLSGLPRALVHYRVAGHSGRNSCCRFRTTYKACDLGKIESSVQLTLGFSQTTSHMLSRISLRGPQGRSEGLSHSIPSLAS